jgi:hypothetical protein
MFSDGGVDTNKFIIVLELEKKVFFGVVFYAVFHGLKWGW